MEFPKATGEYSDLKALRGSWGTVYGPITSRRFGRTLGINLLSSNEKICSFDCVYCEYGPTRIRMNDIKKAGFFKEPALLETEIRQGFNLSQSMAIDSIVIAGLGEPTLHPEFDVVAEKLQTLRDEFFPNKPMVLLSNGSALDSRKVQRGFGFFDVKAFKLDAGGDKVLKAINRPLVKDTVEALIANARRIKGLTVQSCFVQGVVDNTKNEDLDEWMESVGMIKPDIVHIFTLDRVPAISGLKKCDEDTLYTIGAKLEKRTRLKWKVFY